MHLRVERKGNVLTVRHQVTGQGWSRRYLKLADVHLDSPHCDEKLLVALLKEAKERQAPVAVYGDWNDAMQSKQDKRASKKEQKAEYTGGYYADQLVERNVELLTPYKDIILFLARGNHDTKVAALLETDILARTCHEMGVEYMGYSGWVRYLFSRPDGSHRSRIVEYFHHGSGGGGEVTDGVMRAQRERAKFRADIYIGGHTHNDWRLVSRVGGLDHNGQEVYDETLHICIPTLKDEFQMAGGWHVERGMGPRPIGAVWLEFSYHPRCRNNILVDALKAR